jgi:hypothetical protein
VEQGFKERVWVWSLARAGGEDGVCFFVILFFYFLFLPRGKGLKERESVWSLARPLEVKAASDSSFYVSICASKASKKKYENLYCRGNRIGP